MTERTIEMLCEQQKKVPERSAPWMVAEVRQFCDKWEKDVLAPVFQAVRAAERRQALLHP